MFSGIVNKPTRPRALGFRRPKALAPLALVVLLGSLTSCHHYQPLEFRRVQSLKVTHFDFSYPTVTAYVVYYNPNSVGFDFRGASVDVHLDTLWVGHAQFDTTIHIDAKSEFTIPLPMQVDFQRLVKSGITTYTNHQVDVHVDGAVKASKLGVVKTFPVHYEGIQTLNLNLF